MISQYEGPLQRDDVIPMNYRLAVILPSPFSGGVIRSLINICRMLVLGAQRSGDKLKLVVGLPRMQGWSIRNAEIFSSLGIETRFFDQKAIQSDKLKGSYACLGVSLEDGIPDTTIFFDDGIANFEDVDFWYLISDSVLGPLPAHRKYACMVYDYANRYVPEIFDESQWKKFYLRAGVATSADFIVTTTRQTRLDAINFAGVNPEKAHVFPIEFDAIDDGFELDTKLVNQFDSRSFILWPTILSGHENHESALLDLEIFLKNNDLQVLIIGRGTNSFNPKNHEPMVDHPYIRRIRGLIDSSEILEERLIFLDYVSDKLLLTLMRLAFCILHTSHGDNGTYTVVEAAWQGTPAISNRYPAMEEVGEYFKLPLEFFDHYTSGSLVNSLWHLQHNYEDIYSRLPSRDALSRFSYDHLAEKYWRLFSANMRLVLEG